jgi:hypothetical protein
MAGKVIFLIAHPSDRPAMALGCARRAVSLGHRKYGTRTSVAAEPGTTLVIGVDARKWLACIFVPLTVIGQLLIRRSVTRPGRRTAQIGGLVTVVSDLVPVVSPPVAFDTI